MGSGQGDDGLGMDVRSWAGALPGRTAVAAGADLDVLELAVGGALASRIGFRMPDGDGAASSESAMSLTDVEGTPLAVITATDESASPARDEEVRVPPGGMRLGTVTSLRPLARRSGPAFDPSVRRGADAVRAEHPGSTAVVFRSVPSREDLALVQARLSEADGPILWTAMVTREVPRGPVPVRPDGLARAVGAVRPDASVGLVVPEPRRGDLLDPLSDASEVLARYGARRVIDVEALRTAPPAPDGEDAVRDAYPPACADEVLLALRRARIRRGAVILMTGLSGSGKSTLAQALADRLYDTTDYPVTVLDGDDVRRLLSSGLGFDRASRELNVRRIGFAASLVSRSGGIAIAAPIAPFAATRAQVRAIAEERGAFVLVHVATPLAECERRDRKGLYARARRGEIPEFTGISSPYEAPEDADVVIDTTRLDLDEGVAAVVEALDVALGSEPRRRA